VRRRDALKVATAAMIVGAAPALAASRKQFFAAHKASIGLQLYTLGPDLDADFDRTLRQVAAIGYRTVELAGLHGRTSRQFRAALDAAGLQCRSMHVAGRASGKEPSLSGDLGAIAADAHVLGASDVVMPIYFAPPGMDLVEAGAALTVDDYKRMAAFLNEKAAGLKRHGVRLGYHNHNPEFAAVGDTNGLGVLLAETDPALVDFELDVGWAAAAGVDPVDLLNAHPRRFTQMHVKDIKRSTRPNFALRQDPTEVGRGMIDWARILPVAWAAGVRGYFVEQEPPFPGMRIESVAASYRYLAALRTN
jgi:sugar phosphate isomerase/epimerase